VDTKDDNKDMKMLKDELWARKVSIEVKIVMFRKNQIVEETTVTNLKILEWVKNKNLILG